MTETHILDNKAIYRTYHDAIITKRLHSPYPIRRHAHETQYRVFLELVPPGSRVLDVGCGEGALSVLLAEHGCRVTGVDLSEPNVAAARAYAQANGVSDRTEFWWVMRNTFPSQIMRSTSSSPVMSSSTCPISMKVSGNLHV